MGVLTSGAGGLCGYADGCVDQGHCAAVRGGTAAAVAAWWATRCRRDL